MYPIWSVACVCGIYSLIGRLQTQPRARLNHASSIIRGTVRAQELLDSASLQRKMNFHIFQHRQEYV